MQSGGTMLKLVNSKNEKVQDAMIEHNTLVPAFRFKKWERASPKVRGAVPSNQSAQFELVRTEAPTIIRGERSCGMLLSAQPVYQTREPVTK
jgi:hypothetical protein